MNNVLAVSILTAVVGPQAFAAWLPSVFTIRHFANEPGAKQAIRDGEKLGTFYSLALGATVSMIMKNWTPFIFSIVNVAIMVSTYEWALRTAPPYPLQRALPASYALVQM